MDDTEDDARYPPKQYPVNRRSTYNSSSRPNHSNRNPSYPINSNYGGDNDVNDEGDGYEDDELGEDDEVANREIDDQDDEDDDDDDNDDEDDIENGYDESERHQKKRRLESLVSNYEFVARKPPSHSVRNSQVDWTDHATFALLEAWGDRFLQLGRKSLRSEDWQEVAEKLSEGSKVEWTDAQCRKRLDTLKKKYKKERAKMEEMTGYVSKWVFYKKMDMLLNSSSRQQSGLPCGVDSGEYVFMNPRVYLNRSNGLDEMRDSPGESESSDDDDGSDGLPPKRKGLGGDNSDGSSFRLLANSIHKFGEIYEKIENSKRQQMMELEKMRMNFQRELEVQKKQILERAQVEIAKIRQGDDDETDGSAENLSG